MITGDIEINKSFRLETDYNYSSRQGQRAIFFDTNRFICIFFEGLGGVTPILEMPVWPGNTISCALLSNLISKLRGTGLRR